MGSAAQATQTLGRFELGEQLGAGAMGVVYAATDRELGRRVAIKVLHAEVAGMRGGEARARLVREAQAMARLAHPNVVRVHELGDAGDKLFVVMELVDGGSLVEWLRETRTRPEIVAAFLAAGAGLVAAHAAGLVHRDFKPENVLVDRASGAMRVTDFGLACGEAEPIAIDAERVDPIGIAITQTGAIVGTPRYMAPEQFLGEPVGPAADQFAFCVALYTAIHGHAPFDGERYGDLMDSVVEGRIRPTAWSPLRAVLVRGLAPRASDRYASMTELLDAIRVATARPSVPWLGVAGAVAAIAAIVAVGSGAIESRTPRVRFAVVGGAAIADDVIEIAAGPQRELAWTIRRDGRAILVRGVEAISREFATPKLDPSGPAFSPSGMQLAFASHGIYVVARGAGVTERITDGDDREPAWIDDTHVAFTRHLADGSTGVFVVGTTDSTPPRRLAGSRVLDANAGSVLIARDDGSLAVDGVLVPAPRDWRDASFARDGRGVVITTARTVSLGGTTLYEATTGTLESAVIDSAGRLLVAEREP